MILPDLDGLFNFVGYRWSHFVMMLSSLDMDNFKRWYEFITSLKFLKMLQSFDFDFQRKELEKDRWCIER